MANSSVLGKDWRGSAGGHGVARRADQLGQECRGEDLCLGRRAWMGGDVAVSAVVL